MNQNRVLGPLCALMLGIIATACPRGNTIVDVPAPDFTCNDNDECGAGNLCIGGSCLIAQCDPNIEDLCGVDAVEDRDPTCCRVFENCNPITFKCGRDPNAEGIGCPETEPACTACIESPDCYEALTFASFCSGGRCFETAGRTSCTQDFQCSQGERCDRTEFFCVPDAGGCRFCGTDFPELCCADGQACDQTQNACVDLDAGDECTEATVTQDCRLGELCDSLGRCVQCIDDDNCGPGTSCDSFAGLCRSTNRCESDASCLALNPLLRCIDNACSRPECEANRDCGDPRQRCEAFSCVLPAAVCSETDEPNNSSAQAVPLATLSEGYGGVLCRGDFDFISFRVEPQKRYTATVTVTSARFAGIAATLFDTADVQESSQVFSASPSSVVLVGVTGAAETGRFSLQVSSSSNVQLDAWNYTVTLREEDASPEADCTTAAQVGQEPNNTAAEATGLTLGTASTFTRCGTGDADFFRVTVPPLNGVLVTVDAFQNAEGNFTVELLRGPAPGVSVERAQTTANVEVVDSPEGPTEFFVKVALASPGGALSNQAYRVLAVAVPRPAVCDADSGENDGSVETAQALPTTTTDGLVSASSALVRCNPQDVDHASFTIPARLGGTLRLAFTNSEGDLALDLLDATTGDQILSSNLSTALSGTEAIDLPQDALAAKNYLARVRLASTSSSRIEGQTYTLSLSTFDAGVCFDGEPSSDATFQTARCVGTFNDGSFPCSADHLALPMVSTLGGCAVDEEADGCGRTCGNGDIDVVRLGTLEAGRSIIATLRFDPALGDLSLQLAKVTVSTAIPAAPSATPSVVLSRTDTSSGAARDGLVELVFDTVGNAKEHMLTIKAEGTAGHEAQPYSLSIDVSGACVADANESGSGNSTPAVSTQLRDNPQLAQADDVVNASICNADVDVFEILALAAERITLRLSGPVGVQLQVGTRPATLTQPAIPLADGTVTIGASGTATLTVTSAQFQQLFFTLSRTGGAETGDYQLVVDYTP